MSETKYSTLVETLKNGILGGRYASSCPLPSEHALANRFKVSRSTVQQAFRELEKVGLMSRSRGRGTFVSRLGRSRQIGLIVPGVACTDFFQPIVSEINRQARKEAYTLLFAEVFSLDRAERIRQVRELAAEFVRKNVAGIIYEPLAGPGGVEPNDHILRAFRKAKIPVVLLDCDIVPFPQRSDYDVVGVNDVEAGAKIAAHLLSVGARRIHFLVCELCPTTFENRLYGAAAELVRGGHFKKEWVLRAEADDVAALKRHIRRFGRPDAFVCSNDAIAAVFKQTLEKAGLAVPGDVMLTGFADLPVAALMTPSLTTIRQSRDQMGGAAFRRLLERIAQPALPPNEILFPVQLMARDSTRKDMRT